MNNGLSPDIANCSTFALHGHAGVAASATNTIIFGNVGGDNALTGFGSPPLPSVAAGYGYYPTGTALTVACDSAKTIGYNQLMAQACTGAGILAGTDLSGLTLSPGVYCTSAGYFLLTTGSLTLSGYGVGNNTGVWVFQTASYVTTSTTTQIILSNGAVATNVFWAVGSSMTLADTSQFVGTVIAYAGVSIGTNVQMQGRALTSTASITLAGGDTIYIPSLNYNQLSLNTTSGSSSSSASGSGSSGGGGGGGGGGSSTGTATGAGGGMGTVSSTGNGNTGYSRYSNAIHFIQFCAVVASTLISFNLMM